MKKKRRNSKKNSDGIELIIVLVISAYLSSIIDYIIILFVVILVLILIIVLLYFISKKKSKHQLYDINKFAGDIKNQDVSKTTIQNQKTFKNRKQANYTDIEMFARECNAILLKEDKKEWYSNIKRISNWFKKNWLIYQFIDADKTLCDVANEK